MCASLHTTLHNVGDSGNQVSQVIEAPAARQPAPAAPRRLRDTCGSTPAGSCTAPQTAALLNGRSCLVPPPPVPPPDTLPSTTDVALHAPDCRLGGSSRLSLAGHLSTPSLPRRQANWRTSAKTFMTRSNAHLMVRTAGKGETFDGLATDSIDGPLTAHPQRATAVAGPALVN